jgi:hypothetical protein
MKLYSRSHYLESFDPTRHQRGVEDYRVLHAKVELMLSLLFGMPMVVPEPYSFDSWAFLDIGWDVLEARASIKPTGSGLWNPFVLSSRRPQIQYHTIVADLIGKRGFYLSSEPVLDKEIRARQLISKAIGNKDWRTADQIASQFHSPIVRRIERLEDYFKDHRAVRATLPSKRLEECVQSLEKDDPRFKEFEDTATKLRHAVAVGRRKKVNFDDRTDFRRKLPGELDEQYYIGLREYMDTAWNRVVASSTNAVARSFSTSEDVRQPLVRDAEELARLCFDSQADPSWSRLTLEVDASDDLIRALGSSIRWETIMALINTREWIDSNETLQKALAGSATNLRDPWGPLEEALNAHVDFLSNNLAPFVFSAQKYLVSLRLATAASAAAAVTQSLPVPATILSHHFLYTTAITGAMTAGINKGIAGLLEQRVFEPIHQRISRSKGKSRIKSILRKDVRAVPQLY